MGHPPKRHELPSERVADALRQKINNGDLLPGEALPSVTELTETHHVSRATVGKALAQLRGEGLITTRPRWGSFVAE